MQNTWPLFHLFIRQEESDTKKEIYNLENQIPQKLIIYNTSNKKGDMQKNQKNLEDNKEIILKGKKFRRNWLKFNNFSCRHYSFFYLLFYHIFPS